MYSFYKILYFFTILCIAVSLSYSSVSNNDCSLERRDNVVNHTTVNVLIAKCMYQEALDKFYFSISWKLRSIQSVVKRYRISIKYGLTQKCFKADSTDRKFEFFESSGFLKDQSMHYAVTAEPVPWIGVSIKEQVSGRCPVKPELIALPNKKIKIGSTFTFHCLFEEDPVPAVDRIIWRFSNDSENCKHGRYIKQPDKHYTISKDFRQLTITNIKDIHFGCYLVTAESVAGDAEEQRGFLRVDSSKKAEKEDEKDDTGRLSIVLVVILILLSFLLAIAGLLLLRYRQRKRFHVTATPPLTDNKKKKVYISHCCDKKMDQETVLKLANVINKFDNLEAVIDLVNQVPINDIGLSTWISNNMRDCDKILLIFTPLYLTLVNSCINQFNHRDANEPFIIDDPNSEEKVQKRTILKIGLEFSIIDNILFQQSQKSKNIVVVSKGVKSKDFPLTFQNKMHFKFPSKLNICSEEDLDDNFLKIIGVLSDKEPFQLSIDDKVSPYHRL